MKIISIGEILWDVFPSGEHLGGAPFNLAAHARRLGHEVTFISAVGDDERGRRALDRMGELGVPTSHVSIVPELPTGHVTIQLTEGQPDYKIHRPAAYDRLQLPPTPIEADWICYGTLLSMDPHAREVVRQVASSGRGFYDVNLRRGSWTPELVRELLEYADVVKVNEDEARILNLGGRDRICITKAESGCELRFDGRSVHVPGTPIDVVDAVGAGDAWAAAFLHAFSTGASLEECGRQANRLGALVASRPGSVPDLS